MDGYIIEDDLIGLRKTKLEDLEYVLKTEANTENKPYVGQWSFEMHKASLIDETILHIIFEDLQTKQRIGYAILAGINDSNRALELRRIVISEKGRGYGKKALEGIKKLAFELNDYNRLWLDVRLHNERAQYVYRSVGFVEEGILREAVMVDGIYESLKIMSILRTEYRKEIYDY